MKILIYITITLFISNCSFNKVVKHHGVNFLDKKEKKLTILKANRNDILDILGPPSTKSSFDNDLWIYIERKTSVSSVFKLGKKELIVNNVLILEIDTKGLLVKKNLFNINDMNNINFSKDYTAASYSKSTFVYDFLSSLRQKVNDPLGKRRK